MMLRCFFSILATLTVLFVHAQNFVEQDCDFTNIHLGQISIANEQCVWATGRNINLELILEFTRTTDGGQTWEKGVYDSCITCGQVSQLLAIDCDRAFAVLFNPLNGGGAIVKTDNGGLNWDTLQGADFSDPSDFPNWIHFFDDQEAICMGDAIDGYLKLLRTTDGGDTWTRIPQASIPDTIGGETGLTNQYFALENTIWFTTNRGRIFRSDDRGLNWEAFDALSNLSSAQFKDQNNGLAFFNDINGENDTIFKTTDGGETWTADVATPDINIFWLDYAPITNSPYGSYVVCGDSGVYASSDDGGSWQFISNDSSWSFPMDFLTADIGWVGEFHDGIPGDGILKYVGTILPAESVKPATSELQVYPNPTQDQVRLTNFVNEEDASYMLYSLDGRTIKQVSPDASGIINLSQFTAGVYVIQKEFNQQLSTTKITLIH